MKNKVFRRFLRRKVSVAAAIILLTIILACIFGPMFITTDPLEQDILNAYQAPSSAHWFGTDNMGRDIFIRMLYGGRNSLSISFEGVILGTFIGVMLGVCAGYFGGLVDTLISRFLDILLAFPGLLLAIAVVAVLGNGMQNTVIAISIFSIPTVARMVRGEVLSLRGNEYISACKVMGESSARIIFTHIIPNAVSQIMQLLKDLKEKTGTSIIIITHDLGVVAQIAQTAMVMYAGQVVEYAPARSIYKDPLHPYTRGLLKSIPKLNEDVETLYNIKGMVPSPKEYPKGCRFCPRCPYAAKLCQDKQPPLTVLPDGRKVRCWKYDEQEGKNFE